jgi:hypothetical protein
LLEDTKTNEYVEMGKAWLRGEIEVTEFNGIRLNPKQVAFVNAKERFTLESGGMASGKSLAFIVKFILLTQWFPGTRILIGRKTKGNAAETFLKDFVDLCPPGIYEHKVGEGKLIFMNGTEAVFFGLDALQSGGEDLKKAIQDIKSHNFGFVFIDQLEEIEERVFDALNSRVRARMCKHGTSEANGEVRVFRNDKGEAVYDVCQTCGLYTFNQFNMTTNPANFWAFDYFKAHPRAMTRLIETSMLDNKDNLPEQFIQSELAKPDRYVRKFVYGEWSVDVLSENTVFDESALRNQAFSIRKPLKEEDGIKFYAELIKTHEYQIGVDCSEGAVDPCSIQVWDKTNGEQAAVYNAFVPVRTQIEKILNLTREFQTKTKPLVVVESNSVGTAVIEGLKPFYDHIYEREVFNYREQRSTKKLGFQTNWSTKTLLIENTKTLFMKKYPKIHDFQTLEEMKTFVYTDQANEKGAGASRGYHDDNIMAMMLALHGVKARTIEEEKLHALMENRPKSKFKFQYR